MNSKQLDEVSRNFNELMQLTADLNDLKNELNLYSSILPNKEIEKEYLQLLSKYENKQNKWRSKAQKLYDKPDFKLDQEDDWNKATAFIYIQS